ncbi:hypothetical protein FRX31_031353 [Thalictrum thalictroides]|uniref:Uncharacterized protein n=1 Tax=Thalictrum thalictroides TaxID=46969 RepID=A0A7J6V254_THATH|nr:hypothetical protein FRX31_031353 [Thalictrum thalictroides]
MLKEDSISARNKAKSFKKANVCSGGIRSEPEADLYNVDDNPNSTWHNRESKETSNRYAALKKLMVVPPWSATYCSDFPKLAKQSKKVAEAKATPVSIPKNKGKGGKNQRRRNKEVDDKEYELIFNENGNMPDEAKLLKAY